MFGAGDLPALLADQGVAIVFGASTTQGLLDKQQAQLPSPETGALLDVLHTTVTIVTGSLPNLAVESAITVDGVACKVRNLNPIDDGQLTELIVAAV